MAKKTKDSSLSIEEKLEQALLSNWDEPYKLPDNWCWTTIGNVAVLFRGVSYKKHEAHPIQEVDDCLILRGGNVEEGCIDTIGDNVYVNKSLVSKEQLIKKHDIIIVSSTGSTKVIGRAGISHLDYDNVAFGAFLTLARPIEQIYKPYVAYYFQGDLYRNRIRQLASGVNINNIRNEYITATPIPLPPLSEQKRIVNRIESLFAKLDEAAEKVQAVIDGYETRKAAILHQAFSGELTAKWRKQNNIDINSWQNKKIGDLCKIVRGGSPRPAGSPEFYDGEIPFMKVADITRIPGPYVESTEYSIKPAGLKKTRTVKAQTLLLTNSGATLGVPAICTFDTTFNDGIAAFLGLAPESLLFFYYFWTSKTPELRAINKGAAQPNLNTDIIGAVEINLPTVDEQKEIVSILEKLIVKEMEVAESATKVVEKIDTMKKAILAKAFRGELGTNDPDEESAIALLKTII